MVEKLQALHAAEIFAVHWAEMRRAKMREVESDLREAEQVVGYVLLMAAAIICLLLDSAKVPTLLSSSDCSRTALQPAGTTGPQTKRMEMEARSFSAERSRQLLVKVKDYKADLAKLRENAATASSQVQCPQPAISSAVDALLPVCSLSVAITGERTATLQASGGAAARAELGLADDYSSTSAGQRERMLKSTDQMAKTGERIQQGRAQLLETEVGLPPPFLI